MRHLPNGFGPERPILRLRAKVDEVAAAEPLDIFEAEDTGGADGFEDAAEEAEAAADEPVDTEDADAAADEQGGAKQPRLHQYLKPQNALAGPKHDPNRVGAMILKPQQRWGDAAGPQRGTQDAAPTALGQQKTRRGRSTIPTVLGRRS